MSKGDKKRRRALEAYGTLQRAAAMAASHVEQAVHTFGLSASQFGVLETLDQRGPVHQQELAEALGRSKAQMTAIIDALEARALVRRERHAVDRRFISVYLTDAGRVLLAEAAPVRTDAVVALMRELSGEQRTRLTRLCRRLLRVVDPTADGSEADADDAEPHRSRVEEVREEGAGDATADVLPNESADADAAHADVSNP